MPEAGCQGCVNRLDRFGLFGDEATHGYVRIAEQDEVMVLDSSRPLLGTTLDSLETGDDEEFETETDPSPKGRRNSELEMTKIETSATREALLRPPRSLGGILLAMLSILLGCLLGAAVGFFGLYLESANLMAEECANIKPIRHLGLDAMQILKLAESFYCHNIRESLMVEVACPVVLGLGGAVAALRLAYGKSYFKHWSDEESMIELQKLYSLRTAGTKFILRCWRVRLATIFCFQVVVMMWFRYTVDLWLDLQAMKIFLEQEPAQIWFFTLNLAGVFLGLVWTAYEFYIVITTPGSKISNTEIFFSGLTLPLLGQHVTYLSILSLIQGALHPFLFVSTLAEAILESSISSFIQTYAVVFTPGLDGGQKGQLYFSVFTSFVSIGYAFSTIDMVEGGRMLVKVPGFCKSFNGRFTAVFLFRVCEITSRATSLALFQTVTRPYGMFLAIAADAVLMTVVTVFYQCQVGKFAPVDRFAFVRQNFFYVIPSVLFCRMAPILEKDTVITIPPILYYAIRYLELGAMVAVAGEWLDWDLEGVKSLFEDDGFIVAAFLLSSVGMLVFGIIIRSFLSVRTLMDASGEIWSEHEFNNAQHALKNRILDELPADAKAIKAVSKVLENSPKLSGYECRALAKEAGFPESADWDSNFLRAKVALVMKQALQAVEGFDFHRRTSGRTNLQSGHLLCIRSTGRSLTQKGQQIVGQMSNELSNQKFVLECKDQDLLVSGSVVQLRSLATGYLLGLAKTEPQVYELQVRGDWEEEACLFSPLLVYEEIYRSAARFCQFVHMGSDLEVVELRMAKRRGQSTKDWDASGWRVFAINGKTPSREDIDEILQKGRGAKVAKAHSMVSDQQSETDTNSDLTKSLRPGAEAEKRGEYIVQFVRKDSSDTPILAGSKVLLQHAGGWTDTPMGMSECAADPDSEEKEDRYKPRIVDGEGGLTFTLDRAEYGSKDDPSIYQWTADFIGRLSDTVQLEQSFAEKYRTMTVVACNARSVGLDGVKGILQADLDLHMRILSNLLQPIRQEKDVRVEYFLSEVLLEIEFDLEREGPGELLTITGFEDEDEEGTVARMAGLQVGDQLLQVEIQQEDGTVKKISSLEEMRELLVDAEEEDLDEIAYLTFRCKRLAASEDQNETVKKAVAMAESIAELLPTWREIAQGARSCVDRGDYVELREAVLSRTFLFQATCELVSSLTTAGFGLIHDDFAPRALQLHKRFDPAPDAVLFKYFPGRDNLELRDEILISQLEVLTNTWRSLPQIIKEDVPEVVRSLFHPNVEVELMQDAVKVLMKQWESTRECGDEEKMRMPEPLVRFFKHMRPATDESTGERELSMLWIIKAWQVDKVQQRKVQHVVEDITLMFERAESFWQSRVKDAHARAEEAQRLLREVVEKEVVKVVLCSSKADLEKVQEMLSEKLMLTQDFQLGDSEKVPKGKYLVWSQGIVMEKFKTFKSPSPDLAEIRRKLPTLWQEGKDVRLLFGELDFDKQHDESQKALDSLQSYIAMAKTAGEAFDSIKQLLDDLSDVLHKSQLFRKDQEAKRKVLLKEKELQATMRVAERRLQQVEKEKREIEDKHRKLFEEKGNLEADTKKRCDDLELKLTGASTEQAKLQADVKRLESERKELQDKQQRMVQALAKTEEFLKNRSTDSDVEGLLNEVRQAMA